MRPTVTAFPSHVLSSTAVWSDMEKGATEKQRRVPTITTRKAPFCQEHWLYSANAVEIKCASPSPTRALQGSLLPSDLVKGAMEKPLHLKPRCSTAPHLVPRPIPPCL